MKTQTHTVKGSGPRFVSDVVPAGHVDYTIIRGLPGSDCKYWARKPRWSGWAWAATASASCAYGITHSTVYLIDTAIFGAAWLGMEIGWRKAARRARALSDAEATRPAPPVPEPRPAPVRQLADAKRPTLAHRGAGRPVSAEQSSAGFDPGIYDQPTMPPGALQPAPRPSPNPVPAGEAALRRRAEEATERAVEYIRVTHGRAPLNDEETYWVARNRYFDQI